MPDTVQPIQLSGIEPSFSSPIALRMGTKINQPAEVNLNAVLQDVLHSLQYAFAAAAADVPVATPGATDTMFREFLATRTPKVRAAHAARATTLFKVPVDMRRGTFGRFAAIEPAHYGKTGFDGLRSTAQPITINRDVLTHAIEKNRNATLRLSLPVSVVEPTTTNKVKLTIGPEALKQMQDVQAGAKYTKLGLYIKRVQCIEETDEPSDSDEINLGGVYVTPDGKTHAVKEFTVSSDFDAGESVLYPSPQLPADWLSHPEKVQKAFGDALAKPGRLFCEWDIRSDVGWPAA